MKYAIGLLTMQLLGLVFIGPVAASPVTNSFTLTITEVFRGPTDDLDPLPLHPLLGTVGPGTFTYDSNDVGLGAVTLTPGQFQLTLNIFSQAFNESDDIDFPDFPELVFDDGLPVSLNFIVSEFASGGPNPVEINAPSVFFIEVTGQLTETFPGSGVFTVAGGRVVVVPEPPAAWTLGFGLLGLIGVAKRKTAEAVPE